MEELYNSVGMKKFPRKKIILVRLLLYLELQLSPWGPITCIPIMIFELKLNATEDYQSYGTRKSFAVLDNNKLNFNIDYDYINFGFGDAEDNRVLFTFTGNF